MANTIVINNKTATSANILNNTTPTSADVLNTNFPPNAPLDFGSLAKMFTSLHPQSTPPSSPTRGDVYLDDGTNTASNMLGLRWYDGAKWVDFGLQKISDVKLNTLGDVEITNVDNDDRLVYDSTIGKWKNQHNIDGGHF